MSDATAVGALTLHDNFFEFVAEEESGGDHPRTLLAHELEVGQRYYILLTTRAGLYRYDISDVLEVTEMQGEMPLVKFVHKGADMTNLTSEKLHGDQVAQAACDAMERVGMPVDRVQLIPDTERCGYDVLVEAGADKATLERFCIEIDADLARLNVEYAAKRASRRLAESRLRRMRPGWAHRRQRRDVGSGQRDAQYKWAYVMHQWDDFNRSELFSTRRPSVHPPLMFGVGDNRADALGDGDLRTDQFFDGTTPRGLVVGHRLPASRATQVDPKKALRRWLGHERYPATRRE